MEVEPLHVQESENTMVTTEYRTSQGWFAKRYLLAGTLCFGYFCLSSLNMTTSLALIEMTKNSTIFVNGTVHFEPEFDWSSEVKGWILSAYSYGHLTSFLMPCIVKKIGGVTSNGLALFISGIIYVLYPFIVRFSFHLYFIMRVVEGILENIGYLSAFEIWSNWAPKKERSKLMAIHFTGSYIAEAAVFPITGYLAHIWQWPAAYYFTGGTTILVSTIILLSFSNEPSTDSYIAEKDGKHSIQKMEKKFLQDKITYPWKDILTSRPLWALFMMKLSFVCGVLFIGLYLPHYVKDMTDMEIHKVGILSGLPNVLAIIAVPLCGWLADYIQNKNILNPTRVHKMYTFGGLILGAGCVFAIAFLKDTNFIINIILLILLKILFSLSDLATKFVPLYMAPNHSSLVASIISYAYFIGCLFIPMLIGYVVISHDPYEWSIVLLSLGAILLIGGLTFIFFGSSEVQPWSRPKNEPDRKQNMESLLR